MEEPVPDLSLDPLLVRQAAARIDAAAAAVTARHGLDLEQWRMLQVVDQGAAAMSWLSETLVLTGPTTTRTADRLVSAALAYRSADAADRRRVVLRASKRGRELVRSLGPAVRAAEERALAGLDSAQRGDLARLLRRALLGEAASPAAEPH